MKANRTALLLSLIVASLWIGSAIVLYYLLDDWTERSAFGGMFGAIGALFSGLALIGVVYAILLQQEDLQLQREEMKANREELRRSAQAQENSELALRKQNIAHNLTLKLSSLSSMLSFHNIQSTSQSSSGIKQKDSAEKANKIMIEMEEILQQIREVTLD